MTIACILNQCCHGKDQKACGTFGQCSAELVLNKSRAPGGYVVHLSNNPTVATLKDRKLVTVTEFGDGKGRIKAVVPASVKVA